jgi:hypothetical protein
VRTSFLLVSALIAQVWGCVDAPDFYRVAKGSRQQIEGASTAVTSGVWHVLGLRVEGDTFTVSFDGAVLFVAIDHTLQRAGKVALWTKADSVTRCDRLTIRMLP